MRQSLVVLAALGLAVGGPLESTSALTPPDDAVATGEIFRSPIRFREWRVLRDPVTGAKSFDDGNGVRLPSIERIVLAEEAAEGPLRAAVGRPLYPYVEDPARAAYAFRVVLVLKDQPLHRVSRAVRARVEPGIVQRVARMRQILDRIGPLRDREPAARMQLGDRIAEERRLLTTAERAELASLRDAVQSLVRGMRTEILASTRKETAAQQAEVVAYIGSIQGARVLGTADVLNAITADIPAGRIPALLEDLPSVGRVLEHQTFEILGNASVAGAAGARSASDGYDGSSTTRVAILDTGADLGHPGFAGVNALQKVFLATGSQDPVFADDATSPGDVVGHGTATAGLIVGTASDCRGVAPGAYLLNAKCGYATIDPEGLIEESDAMAAADWAVEQGAGVVNASFGTWYDRRNFYAFLESNPYPRTNGALGMALYFDALAEGTGIPVAVPIGNRIKPFVPGPMHTPSDAFNVLCVGGLADRGTADPYDDQESFLASVGPTLDGRIKPDLAAPSDYVQAYATGLLKTYNGATGSYAHYSGSSLAAPHVAGACVLLDDYAAAWRSESVRALLQNSAFHDGPIPAARGTTFGSGGLDIGAAFAGRGALVEGTTAANGAGDVLVRCGPLAEGDRVTLCWNRQIAPAVPSAPRGYDVPVDLDLAAFRDGETEPFAESASAFDNVEQMALPTDSAGTIFRVRRGAAFPAGQVSANWALATAGTTAPVVIAPPTLTCDFAPVQDEVDAGQQFLVMVQVGNAGGCIAANPVVTLGVPAHYRVVGGPNPAVLEPLAPGAKRTVTWQVRAAGLERGARSFSATIRSRTYGADYLGSGNSETQQLTSVSAPGGFAIADGLGYSMPWYWLAAEARYEDWSGGSPPVAARTRWDDSGWTEWAPLDHSTVILPRPATEGLQAASIQYRVPEGFSTDVFTIPWYVVESSPPAFDGLGSVEGRLTAGGDVDAFRFGMVEGDRLDVAIRWTPGGEPDEDRLMADLQLEGSTAVVVGRYPGLAPKPGIRGFIAPSTGTYWLVLRTAGEDRAAGGNYEVRSRVKAPASRLRAAGTATAEGSPSAVSIPFDAVHGTLLGGTLSGEGLGALTLVAPDGSSAPLASVLSADGTRRRIEPTRLEGGTGTYRITAPATGAVKFRLRLPAPRRGRLADG